MFSTFSTRPRVAARIFLGAIILSIAACGGGGGGGGSTPVTYSIGGTVQGLTGSGMVLRNNGGDDLAVTANGVFAFATAIANGLNYSVTVHNQPGAPAQNCTVDSGNGTVAGANVANVSITCPPVLHGTVTNNGAAPLANILVAIYRYSDRLLQATGRTDASGGYSIEVPAGNYFLAAVNDGTSSFAASEWWTAGGGAANSSGAERVTFNGASLQRDFALAAGGRVTGTITAASGGGALQGITARVRELRGSQSVFETSTAADGSYTLNIAPGGYTIVAANSSLQPYATQIFNSALANGADNINTAETLTITAGGTATADMALLAGNRISGSVTDPTDGNVAGMLVLVLDSSNTLVEGVRTSSGGSYSLSVKPAAGYHVIARGQRATLDLSSSDQVANFSSAVGTITGTLRDDANNPISGIAVRLSSDAVPAVFFGSERSLADGSFSIYAPGGSTRVMHERADSGQFFATVFDDATSTPSSLYSFSTTNNVSSTTVPRTFPADGAIQDLGTVTMTAGAILTGTVTDGGANPRANASIQIRQVSTVIADQYITIRTAGDGSYSLGVPANTTFAMVCAFNTGGTNCPESAGDGSSAGVFQFFGNVATGAAGTTMTQDFSY